MVHSLAATLRCAAAAFALTIAAPGAQAAVWQATETWDDTWESRFSEWVAQSWERDTFHDPEDKLTFGLELDCADAIYTMRILFAYRHGLPFRINDPRNGRVLSNETTQWDGYRETRREELDDGTWRTYKGPEYTETDKVRAFMVFVNDITSTLTLANDTYPVPLSELRPGDMYLTPRVHAYIVKAIAPTGAMTTLSASAPRAWREMAEVSNFPSEIPGDKARRDGYRRFKPDAFLRKPAMSVPGASDEQWSVAAKFDKDHIAFGIATQEALASIEESIEARTERLFRSLCDYAIQRVAVVDEGIDALRRIGENTGRQCMSVGEYAEYSTPGRDAKLTGHFRVLGSLRDDPEWTENTSPLRPVVEAIFETGGGMDDTTLASHCMVPVDVLQGRGMSLRQIWNAIERDLLVSDPHATRAHRWGLETGWTPSCKSAMRGS